MSILAIDTSAKVSSVAVGDQNVLLAEISAEGRLTHSETLMSHVDKVLKMAAKRPEDLSAIAVSVGPGSFTGLRIGVSAAKAMAYALDIPLVGVSTLHVLAVHFYGSTADILSIIDAQKNNVYRELCRFEAGELVSVKPTEVAKLSAVLEECAAGGRQTIVVGDGLKKNNVSLPTNVVLAPPQLRLPRAANALWLAQRKLARGETDDPMTLEPVYLRRSEAEILWDKRHG